MKSYLSLVPISAKVQKQKNRVTILCIIISVILVTTIFGMADRMIQAKRADLQDKHGSWHIRLEHISQDIADEISQRQDVRAAGWSETLNADADQPYFINGKKAVLCGTDHIYSTQLVHAVEEGDFPQKKDEIMLSSNAKLALHVQIGDRVTLQSPWGNTSFTVSGFGSDDKAYYQGQTYLVAGYMTRTAFTEWMEQNGILSSPAYYLQFQDVSKASRAIAEIRENYALSEEMISENTAVMGLAGQSSKEEVKSFYVIAALLFVLVLLAGVLMISGTMSSSVAQRTKFFGMMRCIGASRQQIIRLVRLEAFYWCRTAVPVGLVLGTVITWCVCGLLHYGIGAEFASMPVFALSPVGLGSGAVVGIATVFFAAEAPAKRAVKVSPMAAVSEDGKAVSLTQRTSKVGLGRMEITLGVHHAVASKKNWFLMTASFSLSIILFLCFSVGLAFARELLPAMRSWQPDITLNGYGNELLLSQSLQDTIRSVPGVDNVWSCAYRESVLAASSRQGIQHINLIAYSNELLDSIKDSLVQGELSEIYGNSGKAITVIHKDNPIKIGDSFQIAGKEVNITCAVSEGLYSGEYSVICSRETFKNLTGEENSSLLGIKLGKNATEDTIWEISGLAEHNVIFTDMRKRNQEDAKTYWATGLMMYSFLAVIAVITMFNMINSISMSVTSRTKQYGAMRAVGMDSRQLTRMIAAEAFTYTISGLVVGCGTGIALSRFLYNRLLTRYFGKPWNCPVVLLGIIVFAAYVFAAAAVYFPAKRMKNMAVTETINEL